MMIPPLFHSASKLEPRRSLCWECALQCCRVPWKNVVRPHCTPAPCRLRGSAAMVMVSLGRGFWPPFAGWQSKTSTAFGRLQTRSKNCGRPPTTYSARIRSKGMKMNQSLVTDIHWQCLPNKSGFVRPTRCLGSAPARPVLNPCGSFLNPCSELVNSQVVQWPHQPTPLHRNSAAFICTTNDFTFDDWTTVWHSASASAHLQGKRLSEKPGTLF